MTVAEWHLTGPYGHGILIASYDEPDHPLAIVQIEAANWTVMDTPADAWVATKDEPGDAFVVWSSHLPEKPGTGQAPSVSVALEALKQHGGVKAPAWVVEALRAQEQALLSRNCR